MQDNPFLVHIPPAHVSEMPISTKLPMALASPETAGRESKRQRKYNPSLVRGYFHKFKHSSSWGPGKSSVWCSPTYLSAHKRLKYSEITTQTRERPPGCPSLGLLVKRKAGSSWGLFLKPMKSLTYLNSYFFLIALCFFPSSLILSLFLYSFFLCSSSISRIRCCNWAHQSVPLLLRTLGIVSTFVVFTCLKKATDSSLPLYLNRGPTHLE